MVEWIRLCMREYVYGWVNTFMGDWMCRWMSECIDGWVKAFMDEWINGEGIRRWVRE